MDKNLSLAAMSPADQALLALGVALRDVGYEFITVTPESHRRITARAHNREAYSLRDVFGWSRPFHAELLPRSLVDLVESAGALQRHGELLRSTVRYSTLGTALYVHSAYPTIQSDAVFFGPDTYRFAALIRRVLQRNRHDSLRRVVDIGCGSGAGGIVCAELLGEGDDRCVVFSDINRLALRYARVNAALAGMRDATFIQGDLLESLSPPIDLIVANPPYLTDPQARLYRDGGGTLGCELSMRIVRESLPLLAPGGLLILYTGAPIVEGRDVFWQSIAGLLEGQHYEYAEIDPDVFGEELERPDYAEVERIAVVSLIVYR